MSDHQSLHKKIQENARDLSDALEDMSKTYLAPRNVKTLRSFSTQEVTELLGVSESYLRKARHDGRLTGIEPEGTGRPRYSAEQILQMRNILEPGSRNPYKIKPGRRAGDKLQVWSVANFKGGSSKSTVAAHLSMRMALIGYRTLVIDNDAQASLTTFFGYQPEIDFPEEGTIYDAIKYRDPETRRGPTPLGKIVQKTYFPNLDIAPGGLMLSEFEHETPRALAQSESPAFFERMRWALEDVEDDYDVVLIDCSPSLGYGTLSAICASTSILMTVVPDRVDVASLSQFLKMSSSLLEVLSESGGITNYDHACYLISRLDTSIASQKAMSDYLRALFPGQVLDNAFLKSSAVSEAGLSQKTIWEVEPGSMKKQTLDRAIASATGFCNEIHQKIQSAWGREI